MKKFFPLCLILIVAMIWTVSIAGNIDRTPTASNQQQQQKAEKAPAVEKVEAVVEADEMTPEKAARIAEDEASRPAYNLSNSSNEVVNNEEALEEAIANQKVDLDNPRLVNEELDHEADRYRLLDIKADGIVTDAERAEANEILARSGYESDFPPVVMNQVAEVEPNDSCLIAQPIACGDTVMCATQTTGTDDHDWYTFTLDNSQTSWDVTIETHPPVAGLCDPTSSDTYLELWGSPCDTLIAFDDDGGVGFFSLITATLPPGTYAIHEDNTVWGSDGSYHLSLDCVPTPAPSPGDNCTDPIIVGSYPYSDLNQTNCGRGDNQNVGCLGSYDGGEDIFYQFTLATDTCVIVSVDFKTTGWSGFLVDDACPDDGACVASVSSSGSGLKTTGLMQLTAGTYYIMVDTWPSPTCVPDFDLFIDLVSCTPNGMCCYNYPSVLCVDTTEADCATMGGIWDLTKSCAVDTCALEGEFCENAIDAGIDPIGYSDTRTSVPYTDDYEWGGKDVVYTFTVTTQSNLKFSLCNSTEQWRSVLWLYDDLNCGGAQLAYSSYSSSPCSLMAELDYNTPPGTYYLIVDGSGTAPNEGAYTLDISLIPPCIVDCPVNSIPEGEPACDSGYVDTFNGGCNSDPAVFSTIACGDTICGETGTFVDTLGGSSRDTDWYQFTLTEPKVLTATGVAEVPLLMFLIDAGSGDCTDYTILTSGTAAECDTLTISAGVQPAGDYWLWVGPSVFTGYPCGSQYWATLDCAVPPPPPANDSCSAAIPVAVPSSTPGTTIDATVDDTFPTCGVTITAPGVWYSVTGTGNTMTANTCDSTYYDTKMSVFCGSCLAPVCVDGNDDMGSTACTYSGLVSEVSWCSQTGQEYFILVHGYGSGSGDFVLNTSDDGVVCTTQVDCAPPIGRCCYNGDIDCADNTAPECAALGGNWDATKNCVDDPCICPEDEVIIEYTTDTWPGETSWELTNDATGDTVAMVAEGDYVGSNTLYTHNICVDSAACYTFSVHDAYGDGGGPYVILLNGDTVATGDGVYGAGEDVLGIGNGCAPITGACCVDDVCVATNTEDECNVLAGTWHILEDCATFVCPITPANCDSTAIHSNGASAGFARASQCDIAYPMQASVADDFVLAGTDSVDIATVIAWFGHWNGNVNGPGDYDGINVLVYENDAITVPGENHPAGEPVHPDTSGTCAHVNIIPNGIVYEVEILPGNFNYIEDAPGEYRVEIPVSFTLAPGVQYWLEVQPIMQFGVSGQSGWINTDTVQGDYAQQIFALLGTYPYTTMADSIDMAFCLLGPSVPVGRCCYTGLCADNTEAECTALGGTWDETLNCVDDPCPTGCSYTVGDVNGSDSYNGLDITFGVAFFKGGADPSCAIGSCPIAPCDAFFYCGDVNGSCSYNGLDITYGVAYFKGGAGPIPCPSCPPVPASSVIKDPQAPSVNKTKPVFEQKPSLK